MASHSFNAGLARLDEIDVEAAGALRLVPLMVGTTAGTENDGIATVGDLDTLSEFNGSGYTANGITLTGVASAADDANDQSKVTANSITGLSYGNGSANIAGYLLVAWDTNLASSVPLIWYELDTPVAGSTLTGIPIPATGLWTKADVTP